MSRISTQVYTHFNQMLQFSNLGQAAHAPLSRRPSCEKRSTAGRDQDCLSMETGKYIILLKMRNTQISKFSKFLNLISSR